MTVTIPPLGEVTASGGLVTIGGGATGVEPGVLIRTGVETAAVELGTTGAQVVQYGTLMGTVMVTIGTIVTTFTVVCGSHDVLPLLQV